MKTKFLLFLGSVFITKKASNDFNFQNKQYFPKKFNYTDKLKTLINFRSNITLFCDPEFSRPYFGCSIRATENGIGMQVLLVKSDSPAELFGIRVKDVIIEIEGKPINTIHDYNGAVGSVTGKKKVKIIRKVDNQEKVLEFVVEFTK
jgi:C-terminal processing protease CtpA/Prc